MATKILVIGADSADPGLIEKWGAQGDLPNLMALARRACRGRVLNPEGLEAGSVWPCFHTGLNPGNQPQFDGLRYFEPESYSFAHYTSEVGPVFWRELSRAGKRCFVFDAPYTHLDPTINGISIVDFGAHVPAQGTGRLDLRTHPPELRDEILSRFGDDPLKGLQCDDNLCETIEDYRRFRDAHILRIRNKSRIAREQLAKGDWDFVEIAFCELHCMGHHTWHINDKTHPRYNAAYEAALGAPLRDAYRALDTAVGEILAEIGEETAVFFYASHGIGPQYTGTGLLDRILERLETEEPPSQTGPTLKGRIRALWRSIPADIRENVKPFIKRFEGALQHPRFLSNGDARKLFEVHANNGAGGVRVNLMGREARGKVSPSEYEGVLDRVSEDLAAIVNCDTGEPVVSRIIRTRRAFSGQFVDRLPDLLLVWNRNHPIRAVRSPRIGILHQEFADARTGDHTVEGMFLAAGGTIAPGTLNQPVATVDFLPTFRALLDLPPQLSDGRVIVPALGAQETENRRATART